MGGQGPLATAAVRLFYFAGHGFQANNFNYIVPIDMSASKQEDAVHKAIRLGFIEEHMGYGAARLNFIILDACRSNKLVAATRADAGLARPANLSKRFLYAFAAQPGASASDGTGGNSPYAAALAVALRTPGLSFESAFKQTAREVGARAPDQSPFYETGIVEDFCFAGCGGPPPPRPAPDTRIASGGVDSVARSGGAGAPSVPAPAGARPPPPPAGGGGLPPAAKSSPTKVGEVAAQRPEGAAAARAAPAPAQPGKFDVSLLHPAVRAAALAARKAEEGAHEKAAEARKAAALADAAAARARAGAAGTKVETFAEGRYETEFSNGGRNSYGVLTCTSGDFAGDVYRGRWRSDQKSGVGVYEYARNAHNTLGALRYEGEWASDKQNGLGVYAWRDVVLAGGFADGLRSGPGVLRFADGARYEGEWAADKRNGLGVFWSADGAVLFAGRWKDNKLIEKMAR